MKIVGFDPGTLRTGVAVLEIQRSQVLIRELQCWDLKKEASNPEASLGQRLERLAQKSREVLRQWNPALIGIEKAVTFRNMASALKLSEARGVLRLTAYEVLESAEQRLVEWSPTAIKKEAAGFGLSSKDQVRRRLRLCFPNLEDFLGGQELPADAFDALAIAWTTWVLRGRLLKRGLENPVAREVPS